jgi:protoporphyrinogen oxidase
MKKKCLVIGSGFNALATAYFLKKKNFDIKIIFERNIKGVLGSVEIEKSNFDLGYQFFDGLDEETDSFIREMFLEEDLFDFKYGASTYSNNYLYKDHAIPYWMSYGKIFVFKAFLFYFKRFLKSFFIEEERKVSKLSDLYNFLPPNIKHILERACEKHYQAKPHELDEVANEMSTFTNYRQTLFNDNISNFIKKKVILF